MSDIVLDNVSSGYNLGKINSNFDEVERVVNDETLHTTGGNNIMSQNLDMNSNRLLNLPPPVSDTEPARLIDLRESVIVGGDSVYEGLQTVMLQREKQVVIPFRNTTYDELLVTYNYAYLFPQALAIDAVANEVFILRGDGGAGDNTWAWVFVYNLTTGAFKTAFTTGVQWRECLIIKYVGSIRYLYTLADTDVARYDITTLPTNKSTAIAANTYGVYGFSFMAHDGDNWYVQDRFNLKNETTRIRYKVYNSDFSAQKGELTFPIDSVGTINDYINDFPKPQGITFHKGALIFGVGGIYINEEPYISNTDRPLYLQGLHSFTTTGEKLGTALSEPVNHLAKMSELSGYTNSLCENQGVTSANGDLYAMWITLGPNSPDADVDKGIVITKEMTSSSTSVDFSEGQRGSRLAFNAQDFMNTCHESSFVLKNPATFTDITTFQEIIDMMNQLGLSIYSFSGTNQVITDINGDGVPTTGNLVQVTNINGFSFLVKITGSGISTEYWVSGAGAAQVIKNLRIAVSVQVLTTLGLIASTSVFTGAEIVNTTGYTTSGDSGESSWKQNGVTGQTVSQSPVQLGGGLLNDGLGNQWAIVNEGKFNVKSLGVIGDGVADDYVAINACLNHSENTKSIMQGGGLSILCGGKLLVGDNVSINMPTDVFIKGYDSGESNTDGLFTNKSYAVLATPNLTLNIDGLHITDAPATTTGSFMSLNWIDKLTLKNFSFVKDSIGFTSHICSKNADISHGYIYSIGSSANADGLHLEYSENLTISDLNIQSQDDCIGMNYQPGTNSSAGPNLGSKNITITNCVLASSVANGIRIGAGSIGNVTQSDTVVANAHWDNIEISNIVINKLGATGRSIAMHDERTNAIAPHDNISISNITMNDENSVAGQIQIIGNQDIEDVANIGVKNYNRVFLNNLNVNKSGGGTWLIGGIEKLVFDNLNLSATDSNPTTIDCEQVTDLQFKNSDLSSLATSRLLLARDIQKFRWTNNTSQVISGATATIQMENPNITTADIIIKGNDFEGGNNTFATLSAITCQTFHHVGNSRINVAGTSTGTVTATDSKVVDDYN